MDVVCMHVCTHPVVKEYNKEFPVVPDILHGKRIPPRKGTDYPRSPAITKADWLKITRFNSSMSGIPNVVRTRHIYCIQDSAAQMLRDSLHSGFLSPFRMTAFYFGHWDAGDSACLAPGCTETDLPFAHSLSHEHRKRTGESTRQFLDAATEENADRRGSLGPSRTNRHPSKSERRA